MFFAVLIVLDEEHGDGVHRHALNVAVIILRAAFGFFEQVTNCVSEWGVHRPVLSVKSLKPLHHILTTSNA